jgi:hypothetical protein
LFEFWKDRAFTLRLVVHTIAIVMSLQDPCFGQGGKITLDTGRLQVELAGQLAEVPSFVGLKDCRCQKRLLRWRQQRI